MWNEDERQTCDKKVEGKRVRIMRQEQIRGIAGRRWREKERKTTELERLAKRCARRKGKRV